MRFKRLLGIVISGTLAVTALPVGGISLTAKAASVPSNVDETIRILPKDASVFHDTDGNGLGEFEGWGTSLCWWANRLGYSSKMTDQAAKLFFGDEGLDLNIGRYNVGGGDYVGTVVPNEKADIYDIANATEKNPSYSGSKMAVETGSKLASAVYTASDADFGITRGEKVGNYKNIGWINALGAAVGDGGNLTYTVNVKEAGSYTVKMLMCLEGSNNRGVSIRINGDASGDMSIAADTVNADVIASGNNNQIYRVVFADVALNEGENTITIGGNPESANQWGLNFIKMAVIPKGQEGVVEDTLLHVPHITRSDSAVPGYCVNVTKLPQDLTQKDAYEAEFDRVDTECGYAWNYNWDADKNQINILKATAAASGEDFIAEAFSNSPPYFMTNSGCTSGAVNSAENNLREDSYHAFAVYMADVIAHWAEEGIDFQSASPMNEPDTTYWGAYSEKQEGCRFSPGESQSKIIEELAAELQRKKEASNDTHVQEVLENIILSASDETSIDSAITNYGSLTDNAKEAITRIDTHTYGGSNRAGLRALAEEAGENLWMSEVDGAYTAGSNAGEMTAALGLAQRIITDLNGLRSSAWILWNAVDTNADSTSEMRTDKDHKDMKALYEAVNLNGGYWGIAFGDHNNEEIALTKKYYGFGQFTRYIRPGVCIIGSDSDSILAAYDPDKHQAVIVAINTSADDKVVRFDLQNFTGMGNSIQAIRSSGSLASGENWADVSDKIYLKANASNRNFDAALKANSITTFIIGDVTYDKDLDEDANVAEIPLTESMISGSAAWNNGTVNTVKKVVDNNFSTFFDGVGNGYVVIDLGKIHRINAVGYAPRSGYASRCVNAVFYGSNTGNEDDWTRLYTVPTSPAENSITTRDMSVWETDSNHYRYIKYAVDASGNCNVSELKLYGATTNLAALTAAYEKKAAARKYFDKAAKEIFDAAVASAKALGNDADDAVKAQAMAAIVAAYDALDNNNAEIPLTAAMVSGSAPYGNNADNGAQKVVDNNFTTFFDGLSDGYIQIDLGKIYQISGVGYAPRSSHVQRCNGGRFYGSNDGENWTRLYTISENPTNGTITKKKMDQWENDSNFYRYVKYDVAGYSGTDGGCNLSELKLYGAEADLKSLVESYEQKAALYDYASNAAKNAFDTALAAAKALADDADDASKVKAMTDVVAAYDALKPVITYDYITGVKGDPLYDTEGNQVQAHGGQVQKLKFDYDYDGNGTIGDDEHEYWYWIGEDRSKGYRPTPGIHAYISKDLYNWKDMGIVLKTVKDWDTFTTDPYFTALYGELSEEEQKAVYADIWTNGDDGSSGCVLERPKMLYNEKNNNYVIWFHADGQVPDDDAGGNYSKAKAGVAVSDSPFGPFKLLGSYLLNYNPDDRKSEEEGGHVRDMNVFKDDDGTAYVQYSSDNNKTMHISKLNEDYTNVSQPDNDKAIEGVDFARAFIGESREAPAMFKYHDKYYMITSGCTGWDPNPASYAVADHPFGPWTTVGNPCIDSGANTTYNTQSTCVFPVDAANGKFIYMGDRWTRATLYDSRYIWIPVEFQPQERIALRRYSNWKLYELENKGTYVADTKLPAVCTIEDLELPSQVTVRYDDGRKEVLDASWSGVPTAERAIGTANLIATLSNGYTLNYKVHLMDERMVYFFDCDAQTSEYVAAAKEFRKGKLRNTAADQHYADGTAGYLSIMDTDIASRSYGYDVWTHGYYAKADKTIEYAFDLEAGEYTLAVGCQEWWDIAERPMKITVLNGFEDAVELAAKDFTLTLADKRIQENVTFEMPEDGTVRVIISKTDSNDPVLSWISVMQDSMNEEEKAVLRVAEAKEALKTPVIDSNDTITFVTSHENGSKITWSAPQDSAVKISSDGTTAAVVRGSTETEVTLTATITDGVVSKVKDTKSFDITIPAKGTGGDPVADPELEAAKKELEKVVQQASQKKEEDYTKDSWQKLLEALDAVENLPEDADKAAIEAVMDTLQEALDNLVNKTPEGPTDPTEIEAAKRELEKVVQQASQKKEEDYTKDSWQKLLEALDAVENLPEDADKAAIEAVMDTLQKALDSLVSKTPTDPTGKDPTEIEAAKKELEKVVQQASQKKEEDYTKDSWQKLLEALDAVENLPEDADKAAIEKAMSTLQAALNQLVSKAPADPTGKDPTPGNPEDTTLKSIKVSSMKFVSKSYKIAAKKKLDLKKELMVLPVNAADKSVTWTLEKKNSKYASIKNGVITLKKSGVGKTVTVTAAAKDGSGQKAVVKIKIMKNAVTKITVKKKKLTVKAGKKATIKPIVKTNGKKANKKLAWTSSNTEYATVNAKGVVSTKKAGAGKTVTITARSTDGTNKSIKVKVKLNK